MKTIKPNNSAAFICPHVFEDTRPILYVCREDGDWQFIERQQGIIVPRFKNI